MNQENYFLSSKRGDDGDPNKNPHLGQSQLKGRFWARGCGDVQDIWGWQGGGRKTKWNPPFFFVDKGRGGFLIWSPGDWNLETGVRRLCVCGNGGKERGKDLFFFAEDSPSFLFCRVRGKEPPPDKISRSKPWGGGWKGLIGDYEQTQTHPKKTPVERKKIPNKILR